MKKSIVALAVLGSFAGVAAAQSSVTLFGVVDAAARYTSANGKHVYSLASGGSSTSRFGVRGVEDLGGGLKAGFWLESTLANDMGGAGSTSAFWDRRATVSLISNEMGEARLGRWKSSARLVIDDFDVTGTVGLGSVTNVLMGTAIGDPKKKPTDGQLNRFDNQAAYVLPANLGGFYGGVEVSAGEGGAVGNKNMGGRIGYKAGALNVAGGYSTTKAAGADYDVYNIGASYDLGSFKLAGMFVQSEYGQHQQQLWNGSVSMPLGAGSVWVSGTYATYDRGNAKALSGDTGIAAVGYIHNLSKRTALYTTLSYLENGGGANFSLNGNAPAVTSSGRSGGFDVGVKHSF